MLLGHRILLIVSLVLCGYTQGRSMRCAGGKKWLSLKYNTLCLILVVIRNYEQFTEIILHVNLHGSILNPW